MELVGTIKVVNKPHVNFRLMYDSEYPERPPAMRIIDTDPDLHPTPFYKSVRSKIDKSSYVLNSKLNGIKYWARKTPVFLLINELYHLVSTNYPFTHGKGETNEQYIQYETKSEKAKL